MCVCVCACVCSQWGLLDQPHTIRSNELTLVLKLFLTASNLWAPRRQFILGHQPWSENNWISWDLSRRCFKVRDSPTRVWVYFLHLTDVLIWQKTSTQKRNNMKKKFCQHFFSVYKFFLINRYLSEHMTWGQPTVYVLMQYYLILFFVALQLWWSCEYLVLFPVRNWRNLFLKMTF